jgi:hypothetical protein
MDSSAKAKPDPTTPPQMTDNWLLFEGLFITYIMQHRNLCCGTPLMYITRETAVPPAEALATDHDSIDSCLVATIRHENEHFRNDNGVVFNLMRPLIYNDEGIFWQFASRFNDAQDGRSAFLAMKI